MISSRPPCGQLPEPGSLRSRTGRGRPYPAEIVAAARTLVESTTLRFGEIAAQTGVGEATVGRWVRGFGWRRPGEGGADASGLPGGVVPDPAAGCRPRPYRRYGAPEREVARVLVEGSRLGLERIGVRLGIGTATLFRWQRQFEWRRPAPPDRPGPVQYRYRRARGQPYAGDAVGIAQRLVTGTLLSQKRIAAQAGVSQATVSKWIRRRGWTRPEAEPGSTRFASLRRTAPIRPSGDRRGRGYDAGVVAEARRLYQQTELSTAIIAARVRVSQVTVALWARTGGWTRPRLQPGPDGRMPSRWRRP